MKQVIAIVLACLVVSTASAGEFADELGLIELDSVDMAWAKDLDASDFDFITPELAASMGELSESIRAEQVALREAQLAEAAYDHQMAEMTKMLRENGPLLRQVAQDLAPVQQGRVSELLRTSDPRPQDLRIHKLLELGGPVQLAPLQVAPSLQLQRAQDPTGTAIFDSLKMN
ncbi:MAG: hypothetical protein ACI9MC_001495 [Kiritimatiellia bacterium]|jgi:hypothetical protein